MDEQIEIALNDYEQMFTNVEEDLQKSREAVRKTGKRAKAAVEKRIKNATLRTEVINGQEINIKVIPMVR